LLRARIVESQEAAIARELNGKQVCAIMNTHVTIEELLGAVFSARSVPRLYKVDSFGL
jgi:hypothetical protein